jgi:4-hydroxy-tetrahydrodipicolinate reductase
MAELDRAETQGRVLVVGALGRMGQQVREQIATHDKLCLGAALERSGHPEIGNPIDAGVSDGISDIVVTDDIKSALGSCDVVIDFSIPASTLANLHAAADAGVAYVTGTTGFQPEERAEIAAASQRIPVIHAPNFSLAVNVLGWLTREASRLLGDGFDAELLEIHHLMKRDAPSGTALFLAEAVAKGRDQVLEDHLVLERAGDIGARGKAEIGIQTLRGGDNPGEHTVMFVGKGERIELIHRSATREHFASGAVRAAAWLIGREPGLYPIEQVFGLDI